MPETQVYVERRTYRRRRMTDAARLLPILGVLLFLVPLLLASTTVTPGAMAPSVIYVFVVWAMLIMIAGWISHRLMRAGAADAQKTDAGTNSDTAS